MVSVIIPVYNGEKYIDRCFESLFAGDISNIEVIAVNDGSRDSSSEKLHSYEEKYGCLRVIDKENGGAASARRKGIELAKGEYIAFLDIDDRPAMGIYSALEKKAAESGSDVVFCDYSEERGERSRLVKNTFKKGETLPLDGNGAIRYLHSRRAVFPFPWNKIYKTELVRRVEFPSGNFVGEDYNMLLQIFEMCERVEYLDMVGYHYELTENSASRSGYGEATLRAYEHFKLDRELVYRLHPDMGKDVDNYLTTEYMACIVAMGRNKVYNKEMIKEIKSFVRKNFFNYFFSGDVPLTLKGSALALVISYRLLLLAYKIIK